MEVAALREEDLFRPVIRTRASEHVVEQIKEAIFSGKLAPGDRLPAERKLVDTFGLSRITIRDALRKLEAHGLVRVVPGANGGAFVAEANPQLVGDALGAMLKLRRATVDELLEARRVIEASAAELAAARATAEDLAALRAAVDHTRQAIEADDPFVPASVEFHVALARAAHNRVLEFTVESLRTLLYEALSQLQSSAEMPHMAMESHRRIYEAVRDHDATLARSLMQAHLKDFETLFRQVREQTQSRKE